MLCVTGKDKRNFQLRNGLRGTDPLHLTSESTCISGGHCNTDADKFVKKMDTVTPYFGITLFKTSYSLPS